jgi:thiol:disulfide interchange protein DsbD
MVLRLFLVLLISSLPAGLAAGQENFSDFLNGKLQFEPVEEKARTVNVSAKLTQLDAHTVELHVTVTPPPSFYIYSTSTPKGQKTRIAVNETAGLLLEQQGFTADRKPKTEFVDVFEGDVEKFLSTVTWSRKLVSEAALAGSIRVSGTVSGQICTDGNEIDGGQCVLLIPPPEFLAEIVADETLSGTELEKSPIPASMYPSTVVVTQDGISPEDAKVGYTVSLTPADAQPGAEVTLSVQADIAETWHTYSNTMPADALGGTPTKLSLKTVSGLEQIDDNFTATSAPRLVDNPLGDPLEIHEQTVTWTRRFVVTDGNASITGTIQGQLCTEKVCEIPGSADFAVALGGATDATSLALSSPDSAPDDTSSPSSAHQDSAGRAADSRSEGLLVFLLTAVGAGLVALLTPCVFPMIPVTVAFFLKQGESGKGNTRLLAVIYCLGIVGSFTVIGVLVSIVFGPQTMTELANGPWLNLFFAAVFVAFALMLMGVFELRVPTSLLNWSAQQEGQGGVLGVLFMALTFTLVSFTCTAAFVAPLLVEAAKGDYLWPTLGMLAFSTAFASPFFFLAQFPRFLSRLPKSGGWMQKVKCTAGLLELALVVKFLSVADIGFSPTATPRFIDFSTAMVLWATLAFVTGLYLLGVFRFSKDTPTDGISPIGGLWAMGSIGLGLLICVGMFSPTPPDSWVWNRLVGFAPPRFESAAGATAQHRGTVKDEFAELASAQYALSHDGLAYTLQLDDAVRAGQLNDRPVFVDFTGVNCQNCRDMENDVMNRPDVVDILSTLPRAQLYLDRIPTIQEGEESERLLEMNRRLSKKFTGGYSMPTYVVLSPDGRRVMSSTSGVVSREEFTQFLKNGIRRFDESQKELAVGMSAPDGQL